MEYHFVLRKTYKIKIKEMKTEIKRAQSELTGDSGRRHLLTLIKFYVSHFILFHNQYIVFIR